MKRLNLRKSFLYFRVLVAEFFQSNEPRLIYKIKPEVCQKKRKINVSCAFMGLVAIISIFAPIRAAPPL
jgi:hypothetical protein